MKSKIKISVSIIAILVSLVFVKTAKSQEIENDYQVRTDASISFSPMKKIELSFTPEFRYNEFLTTDKFLFETKLAYKPVKGLSVGGSYRFVANDRETKSTEYLHRFALDAKYQKSFNRWKPFLRIKYTNYTEEASKGEFLRYKAGLIYNIKKCKISPLLSIEPYHELTDNEFYKIRYSIGAKYKLNKNSSLDLGYKLDYYMQDFLNKHIFSIGYNYKF